MRRNNCWLAILAVSTALPILRHGSARERVPVVYGSQIDRSKSAYHANRGSLHSTGGAVDETDAIYRDETTAGPVSYISGSNEPNSLSKNDRRTGWITSSSPDITWQSTGHANLVNENRENAESYREAGKPVDTGSKEHSTGSFDSVALQDRSQTANGSLAGIDKTQEPVSRSQVSGERRLSWIYRGKVNISPGTIDDVIHKDRETVRETSAIPKGRRGIRIRGRDRQAFRGRATQSHQGRGYYSHVESSSRDDDTVTRSRGDGETRTGFENSPEDRESPDRVAGNTFNGVDIGFEGPGVTARSGEDSGSRYAIGNADRFGRHVSIGSGVIQTARGKIGGSLRGGVERIRKQLDEQHRGDSLRRDGDLVYAKSRKKVDLEELGSMELKTEETDMFAKSRKKLDVDHHGPDSFRSKAKEANVFSMARKNLYIDDHGSASLKSGEDETDVFSKSKKKLDADHRGSEFFRPLNKETEVSAKTAKRVNIHQQVSGIFRSKKKEARVFSKSRKKLKDDGQVSKFSDYRKSKATFEQTKRIVDQHRDIDLRGPAKAEVKTFQESKNNDAKNEPQFSELLITAEAEDRNLYEQPQVLAHSRSTEEEKEAKMSDNKVDIDYQQRFLDVRGSRENSAEQNLEEKLLSHFATSSKEHAEASEHLERKFEVDHPQFESLVNPPVDRKIANELRPLYLWRPRTGDDRSLYSLLRGKRRDRRNAETSQQSGSTVDPDETGINPAESRSPFEQGSANRSPVRREDEEDVSEREELGTSCKPAAPVTGRATVSSVSPEQRSTVNNGVRDDNGEPCTTAPVPADPGTSPDFRFASDRPSNSWKNEELDAAEPPGKGFHGLGVANEFLAPPTTTARTPSNSTASLKDTQLENAALIAPAAESEDRTDTRRAANEDLRVAAVAAGNGDFDGIDCAEKNVKLSGSNDRDKDSREPGTDRSNYTANESREDRRDGGRRDEECSGENQRNDYMAADGSDDLKFNERGRGNKGDVQMVRATDSGSYDMNREDHGYGKSAEERFSEGRLSEGRFSEDYGRDRVDDGQSSGRSDGARDRYSVSNGGPGFTMGDREVGDVARKFDYSRNRGDNGEFSGRSENNVGGQGNVRRNNQSVLNGGLVRLTGDNEENGVRVEELRDGNDHEDSEHFGRAGDIQKTNQVVSNKESLDSTNHNQVLNNELNRKDDGDWSNQNNSDKENQSASNGEPIYSLNHNKETGVLAEKLHFERDRANTRTVLNNEPVGSTDHNKRNSTNAEQSARRINRTYADETAITKPNQSTSNSSPANLPTPTKETVVESTGPSQSPKYQQNETVNETLAHRTVSANIESISATVDSKDDRAPRTINVSCPLTNDTTNKTNDAADKEAREERKHADKKAKKEPAVASSMKRSTSKGATKESGNAPTDSERGRQAIGRNSAYPKSDMNTADVERESRIPGKNDETAGDRLARRKPAKGYPRNSNNSENPEYQPTEAIINPEVNETVSRASFGSSKIVAKEAKEAKSISLGPNYRQAFDEEVNEQRIDGLVIVSEGPGSSKQNRESMPDDEPDADLLRTKGLRKEKRSRSSKNFEPSSTTLPNSVDSLSADASSKISSDDISRPTSSGTTEDQSAITSEIYEPVTSWIEDPVTSADGQDLENSLEPLKTVAKGAKGVESTSLKPDYRPGFNDEFNERRVVSLIASEGFGSLYRNSGSMPVDEPVADVPEMQRLRKEKRSKPSKNFDPSSTALPNSTDILSAVASSKISPVDIARPTTSGSTGDRSVVPSESYEPVTSWSEQSSPVFWTDSSQNPEISPASLSNEELDRSSELDSTVASLENEDDVRLSLYDELAGSDNASSHDLERRNWPVKHSAVVEGDLVLGGLMMVHEREDSITCGPVMPQGGVQALEAMLYTLDWLNDQDFVPGVKIGAHILDDCDKDTYGLEMAVDFIKGSISNIDGAEYHCNKTAVRKVISGVVGAASSVTSIQVANLLRLFRIPQVSFFSTSPELSNKQRFEYFARTIPSDHYQVKAMVDIVMKMGWRYVSIIYEESNYGIKAFEELEELLGKNEICIAVKEKLVKDSGVAEEAAYDNIVDRLKTKPRARGCIIFGSDQEVAGVMRAVRRCNATGAFSWIGSDGWSARGLVSNGNEPEVEGTLSVQPQANPVRGFEEYFLNLTVENNRRNPWFVEFWEDHFKCKYPNSSKTPYNQKYTEVCTTKERLTKQNTAFEDQLQFVSDAVMAFVYAFKAMHEDLCFGKPGLCDAMKPTKGTELLKYLHKVDFEGMLQGLSGDKFKFDKNGDGPARYNIIHFKQTEPGKYKWVRVGKYLEGELRLNMSEIQFKLGHPQPPESVCSLPCEVGQAKKYVEGERCCWHCFNCTQYQIRKSDDETQCIPCRQGTVPDETHSTCRDIPEEFLRPESGWAIGAMSFSASGILITFFVCGVFLKHNDTPVVRASGRELSYILLCGILLCYLVTFALVLRPTDIVCSIQRFAAGFCFTVVYAALLTKTNRISRIFNASKHSAKRPSFISPRSQLIICSGLVFVQILINGVWIIIDPARAMHHYPTREDNLLVCNSYVDASYMIAFAYPIMLIVVCTVYAVLTRKIPEAFNESKHIGFTMYTTCVIWLAFVPLYFGTGSNVALRITSMSVTISLSASVTIACLFSPKLYIILIRPERNVRQSMMPARYSTTKSSAVTATNASSMIAPVTLTAATCDQNKAVKKHIISTIDCWTQSEYYELEVKDQKNGKPTPTVVSRLTQTSSNDLEQSGNLVGKDAKENPTTTSKENASTTKQLNNNARIGNGPVNQADVSL